jgi:cbb3-type cytochrome oxidase subunit 3
MTLAAAIGEATTLVSFAVFAGVVWFACGKGRARRFDEAAQAPFALPDEVAQAMRPDGTTGQASTGGAR